MIIYGGGLLWLVAGCVMALWEWWRGPAYRRVREIELTADRVDED